MVAIPSWLSGGYVDSLDTAIASVRCPITVDIGATGAPTLRNGTGRVTVTRVSAGLYRFALASGRVARLLKCIPVINNIAAAAVTDGNDAKMTLDSVTSNTAPLFEVTCYQSGNLTAADPKSGSSLTVDLVLGMQ